ncbi:MAG: SPOR domain-containing protein [Gemmatimonadota bacterium]
MISSLNSVRALLGGATLLGAVACGGSPPARPGDEWAPRAGAELVAGSSLDQYGLLVVPQRGGPAHLRSFRDPSNVLWSGRTPLPASSAVYSLEASILLRTEQGRLYRYRPGPESLTEVGRVGPNARWWGGGGSGVLVDGSTVIEISEQGEWRHEFPGAVLWAAPVENEGMAVLEGPVARPTLSIREREGKSPAARASILVSTPGVVTAWGRRLALAEPDAGLALLDVPGLEPDRTVKLDRPLTALAASPSSHEIYVATRGPVRLLAVSRFSGEVRELGRFERPLQVIRPAVLGGSLLLFDGEASWLVPVRGRQPEPLPTRWRRDLPLALPGPRVLVATDSGLAMWDPAGSEAPTPLAAPSDAWWLPLRWHPSAAARRAGRAAGAEAGEEGGEGGENERQVAVRVETGFGVAPSHGVAQAPADAAAEPGPEELSASLAPPPIPTDEAAAGSTRSLMPAGFYAVVSSSQALGGIRTLARRLSAAGFPTRIQRHRDEANEVWYRALVGPYTSRRAAERMGRRLRRERGLQSWIAEVAPDSRLEEVVP